MSEVKREATSEAVGDSVASGRAMGERAAEAFRGAQERLTAALSALDGATFREDAWQRAEGGGGRTRVIADGALFEKGGVNFSLVHGENLPPAITKRRPEAAGHPWVATGTSLVLHPKNPYVPTVHMNVRFFSAGPVYWFGGGADLTPYYGFEEDAVAFHGALKRACDATNGGYYARFKPWCDRYFYLPHRGEQRGVGGIFFDDLGASEGSFEQLLGFTLDVVEAFLTGYTTVVERRRAMPFGERERGFQLIRRGRYVEFNLVYDQGTLFGLQTNGRTESILMSLPPAVRWEYDWRAEEGSPEQRLTEFFLKPRDWLELGSDGAR